MWHNADKQTIAAQLRYKQHIDAPVREKTASVSWDMSTVPRCRRVLQTKWQWKHFETALATLWTLLHHVDYMHTTTIDHVRTLNNFPADHALLALTHAQVQADIVDDEYNQ